MSTIHNTLLCNDSIMADLKQRLEQEVGPEQEQRYGTIFEQLQAKLDYAGYLGALQRCRLEHSRNPHPLAISRFLVITYRLFPKASTS